MPTQEKVEEPKKEVKEEKSSVRDMTKDELKEMMGEMPAPEGYKNPLPTDGEEAEGEEPKEEAPKKEGEKSEEKVEEKGQEKQEEKPTDRDVLTMLETELAKPVGKEDLSHFTQREKAYFYQMRRDRKNRQKAETERDQALFRVSKLQKEAEAAPKKEEADPLAGRDDGDFLTVAEAKAILKNQAAPAPKAEERPAAPAQVNGAQVHYLQLCEKEGRETHEDFDTVMELTGDLLEGNKDLLPELSDRVKSGENPALVMYDLIKTHPEFEKLYPAAEAKVKARLAAKNPKAPEKKEEPKEEPKPDNQAKEKEAQAKRAQEKLELNNSRPKTTAHISSRENKPEGELTLEEISRMSDKQFHNLSPNIRKKYLRELGV